MATLGPAIRLFLALTALTGLVYPLAVTVAARLVAPAEAGGSLIVRDGRVIGSRWIGQAVDGPRYFEGRPSATSVRQYDAASSTGSNLGPENPALGEAIAARRTRWGQGVPIDLVTSSASGLDPHISPDAAYVQAMGVARARGLSEDEVRGIIRRRVEGRELGVLGEPRVNVLELNLDLDALP